jgi:hypothetical protein
MKLRSGRMVQQRFRALEGVRVLGKETAGTGDDLSDTIKILNWTMSSY